MPGSIKKCTPGGICPVALSLREAVHAIVQLTPPDWASTETSEQSADKATVAIAAWRLKIVIGVFLL